jgi:hypothetical protein
MPVDTSGYTIALSARRAILATDRHLIRLPHPSLCTSPFDTESAAITTLVLASMYRHVYTTTLSTKPTKQMYSLRLDPDLAQLLKVVKERDGIPESEQIRRALVLWFEQKGVRKQKHKQ